LEFARRYGGVSSSPYARDLTVAEGVEEQPVVVARDLRVSYAEAHHLIDALLVFATNRRDDLILRLEA
jgi:hypothetical protein